MFHRPITPEWDSIPGIFHTYLRDAAVYDSSFSAAARVFYLDNGPGFYLKTAPKGTLKTEAAMTRFFHGKGLSAEVLAYESLDTDWLLTTRIPGDNCLFSEFLENPTRLCDTTAALLRMLHDTDPAGCPVPDRTTVDLSAARRNYTAGAYDTSLFPDNWGYTTPEEAWREIETNGSFLRSDTLLHGDYCLPNIILQNWRFSGFIDLGGGGVGDRHMDLFWATWSLQFNLKTDRYRERFLDAYGREDICEDRLRTIAAVEVFV